MYQAVSSSLRNALPGKKSRLQQRAWTMPSALAGRILARLSGVRKAPLDWRLTHEAAFFENQVATLELDGRGATITFEKAVLDTSEEPDLEKLYSRRLAP